MAKSKKRKLKFSTNDELKRTAFNFMNKICKFWSSQKRPPKVSFLGTRLHHYYYGLIGLVLGMRFQSSIYEQDKKLGKYLEGASMALLIDDYPDFEKDLKKFLKNILKF